MSTPTAGVDDALLSAIRELQFLGYARAGIIAGFIYDYLILLPREINHMWIGSKWTRLSALYVICRYMIFVHISILIYLGTASNPSTNSRSCRAILFSDIWLSEVPGLAASLCFYLRANALWGDSKLMRNSLGVIFCCLSVVFLSLNIPVMRAIITLDSPVITSSIFPRCSFSFAVLAKADFTIVWIIIMSVDDLFLTLLVIGAKVRRFRYSKGRLLEKIYHDAIFYFALNLAVGIISIIAHFLLPGAIKQAAAIFASLGTNAISCRVLLRLRTHTQNSSNFRQDITAAETMQTGAMSTLKFRHSVDCEELTAL